MSDAERIVAELFVRYSENPEALPPEWREQAPKPRSHAYARYVADFIAGMTDRYALAEHRRLEDIERRAGREDAEIHWCDETGAAADEQPRTGYARAGDPAWIEVFGELMILQLPDDMSDPPPEGKTGYGYLMQFADGNRIDLSLFPVSKLDQLKDDSLTLTLLDKDGVLPKYAPPNDSGYLPRPPTAKKFFDCTNDLGLAPRGVA